MAKRALVPHTQSPQRSKRIPYPPFPFGSNLKLSECRCSNQSSLFQTSSKDGETPKTQLVATQSELAQHRIAEFLQLAYHLVLLPVLGSLDAVREGAEDMALGGGWVGDKGEVWVWKKGEASQTRQAEA